MGVWSSVESALYAWVSGAVPGGWTVIFAEQQGQMPETPTVTIRIGDPRARGAVDDMAYATNGGSAPNDLNITANGYREFGVTLQAYGGRTQATGDNSPRAALSLVRQSLELPNARYALQHTAGLSPFDDRGPVRNVATVAGTIFEPRAVWECQFAVVESQTQTSTWIETVDAGTATPGPQQPVPGTVTDPAGNEYTYPPAT